MELLKKNEQISINIDGFVISQNLHNKATATSLFGITNKDNLNIGHDDRTWVLEKDILCDACNRCVGCQTCNSCNGCVKTVGCNDHCQGCTGSCTGCADNCYETCYGTCYTCQDCQTGCTSCNACTSGCDGGCQTECYICVSCDGCIGCNGDCVGCFDSCQESCQTCTGCANCTDCVSCQPGCQTGCYSSIGCTSDLEENKCTASCQLKCQTCTGCDNICYAGCTSCDGCTAGCQGGCQTGCQICTAGCQTCVSCNGCTSCDVCVNCVGCTSCVTSYYSTGDTSYGGYVHFDDKTSEVAYNPCVNSCQTNCQGSCQSGCQGSRQTGGTTSYPQSTGGTTQDQGGSEASSEQVQEEINMYCTKINGGGLLKGTNTGCTSAPYDGASSIAPSVWLSLNKTQEDWDAIGQEQQLAFCQENNIKVNIKDPQGLNGKAFVGAELSELKKMEPSVDHVIYEYDAETGQNVGVAYDAEGKVVLNLTETSSGTFSVTSPGGNKEGTTKVNVDTGKTEQGMEVTIHNEDGSTTNYSEEKGNTYEGTDGKIVSIPTGMGGAGC